MSGQEVFFEPNELIVSKTDLNGKIAYVNRTFMQVANFNESQLLGFDHNIIRHADMPKGVFYGLWKTLKSGEEFFGFIKNRTADNNYYWVFANITPDKVDGQTVGYYSVRRYAPPQAIQAIIPLYQQALAIEAQTPKAQAAEKSWHWIQSQLEQQYHLNYEPCVIHLYQQFSRGDVA